ncbi:hypothetical protein [Micromonospora sp. NBRC 107095]|uniref:hypothetical protein n=1 Tax=Micromonospora sp. NBRC 107095 TaxID=3032209 RepID=UPI0024A2DCA8|nr:hypothetical protein [Micromonospora sp. NBRC 107095]GLZ60502.1 hypothetical protein Misp05_40780 [Micromonospora sp. NBRC 107095]
MVDAAVVPPEARTLARTPTGVQAALRALSNSRFFAAAYQRVRAALDSLLVRICVRYAGTCSNPICGGR